MSFNFKTMTYKNCKLFYRKAVPSQRNRFPKKDIITLEVVMKTKVHGCLSVLKTLILYTLGIGLAGFVLGQLVASGLSRNWQSLGEAPQQVTSFIDDVRHPRGSDFCLQAVSGEILCYWGSNPSDPWHVVMDPAVLVSDPPHPQACNFNSPIPPRNRRVVDKVERSICFEFASWQRSYILLEDNTIWVWERDQTEDSLLSLGLILGSVLLGFVVGVVVIIIRWIKTKKSVDGPDDKHLNET
jgi:hypothetical protein